MERFDRMASISKGLVDPKLSPYLDMLHVGPDNISGHTGTILQPLRTARELGLISGKFAFHPGDILYSKIRPNLNKVLQAMGRKQMHMADWISKLDEFLKLADRDVLKGAGRISADTAKAKAEAQFDTWHSRAIDAPSAVERHFAELTGAAKQIEKTKAVTRKGKRNAS